MVVASSVNTCWMPNEHILHICQHEANHCLMADGTHLYIYIYAHTCYEDTYHSTSNKYILQTYTRCCDHIRCNNHNMVSGVKSESQKRQTKDKALQEK